MADSNFTQNDDFDLTDDEINRLAKFEAAISDEDMIRLEEAASTSQRGVQRRLCLLACARSSDQISQLSMDEPEAFGAMLDSVKVFMEHAEAVVEISKAAYFRMNIADCRDQGDPRNDE